jgi:lysozyme family protein
MGREKSIDLIIEIEGGDKIVNDPRDAGGLTKFGISQRAYPHLDIAGLTLDQAREIYRKDYWDKVRADELPPRLALCVFDCAVNQGVGAAIRVLQDCLGVKADGVLGPVTLGRAKQLSEPYLVTLYMAHRAMRYTRAGSFTAHGLGWFRRLFEVSLHLPAPR